MKYVSDVVQVVRCKDCKNFDSRNWYCYYWDYEPGSSPNRVDDDDFCSHGERKEEDAENERTRQESVSMKVYQMMCEERDAAVNDLSLTNTRKFNNPCEICKHNGEKCEPVDLQSVCCKWEWRGPQKEK